MNKRYLNRNNLTDVIAFSTGEDLRLVEGDIFISIDRVRENSIIFKQPLLRELCRVMAHGVLHVSGWKDDSKERKISMHNREDFFLNMLPDSFFK
jgi:rRNA maturation RNase YbeY